MNTTGIDESERQCFLTFYLYSKQLYYLACGSSHLYGGGLSIKLLNLHSNLPKGYTLWLKPSLQR
jgi:hypothetical protein